MTTIAAGALATASIKYNRRRKEKNQLLLQFQRLAANYKIQFSRQEVLNRTIIGLDEMQRKLLILKKRAGATAVARLIDLTGVRSCFLEKQYSVLRTTGNKKEKREQRFEKLILHILLEDGTAEEIIFYNYLVNPVMDLTKLANKAEHWEIMLTKLLEQKRQIA